MTRKKLFDKIKDTRREYIRKRDSDYRGYAKCISCGKVGEGFDVGHYHHGDFTNELTGDERNVNLQCKQCNSFKHGNPRGYAIGLIRKYGKNILIELETLKKDKYWRIKDLENLLGYYKKLLEK